MQLAERNSEIEELEQQLAHAQRGAQAALLAGTEQQSLNAASLDAAYTQRAALQEALDAETQRNATLVHELATANAEVAAARSEAASSVASSDAAVAQVRDSPCALSRTRCVGSPGQHALAHMSGSCMSLQ